MAVGGALVSGNGWDAVQLDPGERLVLPDVPSGMDRLRVRTVGTPATAAPTRLRLLAVPAAGAGAVRELGTLDIVAGEDGWGRGDQAVSLGAGERLAIEAISPATIQGVTGWMPRTELPPGWALATETDRASVLERSP